MSCSFCMLYGTFASTPSYREMPGPRLASCMFEQGTLLNMPSLLLLLAIFNL